MIVQTDFNTAEILVGECRTMLDTLADRSVHCCVTSPPYYGLRDYGVDGQIGLEPTPDKYVAELVSVFRDVWRVLRDDGTLWLNIGDSYANDGKWGGSTGGKHVSALHGDSGVGRQKRSTGLKSKDLMMIPARVAMALQADGWYLRSNIIWHKPNPMPESVKDRPTSAHESVFMFTKQPTYFYDELAAREPATQANSGRPSKKRGEFGGKGAPIGREPFRAITEFRNWRNVWTISSKPYKGAHFATMPIDLAEQCISASSRIGDTVLDPFGGAGTTACAAVGLGRNAILTELNPEYVELAATRLASCITPDKQAAIIEGLLA